MGPRQRDGEEPEGNEQNLIRIRRRKEKIQAKIKKVVPILFR